MSGVELADLTWREAERVLTDASVVLLPLGAAAKQHGPHLRLDNDRRLAEALAARVMARCDVVVLPTVTYHHYPAFLDYPGSVSLAAGTARDLVVDIARSVARYGPIRFYVLNTGVSTTGPLQAAARHLEPDGIRLAFSDIEAIGQPLEAELTEQRRGGHADEIETSLMLHLAPDRVALELAVRDDRPRTGEGGFVRQPGVPGIYSPSGVWGDATLASEAKGRRIAKAMVDRIVAEIDALRCWSA